MYGALAICQLELSFVTSFFFWRQGKDVVRSSCFLRMIWQH